MLRTLLELLLAPALVAASTVTSRRRGVRLGGLVSGFPAVAGPVLLVTAQERGSQFAQNAANGTLLGLIVLSGFAVAYSQAAPHWGWPASLAVGWSAAALLGLPLALVGSRVAVPVGLAAATTSLWLARKALPAADLEVPAGSAVTAESDLALRVVLTALLVAVLSVAARLLGPVMSGVANSLPVLASVLAACVHRQQGPRPAIALLRGMLTGMAGFVSFCATVMFLIVPVGIAASFVVALLAAVSVQALTIRVGAGHNSRPRSAAAGGLSRPARPGASASPSPGNAP